SLSHLGLSSGANCFHVAVRVVDCRSCLYRAGNVGNRNIDRADRRAGVPVVAKVGERCVNPFRQRAAKYFCYASEIQETTNGGRRGPLSQTRKAIEVIAPWRIEEHVQID